MAKTYTNIQRHGQGLIAIPVKVNKSIPGIKKRWCWVLDSNFFLVPAANGERRVSLSHRHTKFAISRCLRWRDAISLWKHLKDDPLWELRTKKEIYSAVDGPTVFLLQSLISWGYCGKGGYKRPLSNHHYGEHKE